MNGEEVLRAVVGALESAGIESMLTGSFASSLHGAPRATRDLDLVILATPEQLRRLRASLPESDWLLDLGPALDAARGEPLVNLVHHPSGWKCDLIFRKSDPFHREEFERRRTFDLDGMALDVATAEDVIVAKLAWSKGRPESVHVRDVAALLQVRNDLDRDRIERWVAELELEAEWRAAQGLPAD